MTTIDLHGQPDSDDRVGFVHLDGAKLTVRVRWRAPGAHAWRCDACGRSATPRCAYARAVDRELEREEETA